MQNPSGRLTVSGTGVAGTTVKVTFPDNSTATGTVDADGHYSVVSQGVQTTGTVSAVDSDSNGHSGSPVSQTWTDDTLPQAPVVSAIQVDSDGSVIIKGTAEANSTITVHFADGTVATGVAGTDGSYSVTSSTAETGAATVTAKDAAGNVSAVTNTTLITSSATSADDGTMTVTGAAAPNSVITVTFADGSTATGTAGSDGSYSVASDTAESGTFTITAAIPPQAPVISEVTANADGTMTVSGTAEANSIVMVTFADGSSSGNTADADGVYSVTSNGAQAASGSISVTGISQVTDVSSTTAATVTSVVETSTANTDGTLTVEGTAQPGSLVTVTFADGSTATGTAGSDGSYSVTSSTAESGSVTVTAVNQPPQAPEVSTVMLNSDGTVTVTGTAEPNSTVTVIFADGSTATTAAGSDGSYQITSSAGTAEPSSGTVSVTAADTTGHVSSITAHDYATATPPTAVNTTANTDGTMTVSGTAEAGDTLTITFPDHTSTTAVAGDDGSYHVTSSTVQTNGNVSVTATDQAGHISQPTNVYFNDDVPPQAPVVGAVDATTDGIITVTGTAEPNSTVTVFYSDGTSATGTAGADGAYTVVSNTAESGAESVTATDAAGNESAATVIPMAIPPLAEPTQAEITAIQHDTGADSTDFITSDNALVISGTLSQPLESGQSVEIRTDSGQDWNPVTVASDGASWSYDNTANPLPDGTYTFEVRTVDGEGNLVGGVSEKQVVIDTLAPDETVTIAAIGSADSNANDFVTDNGSLTISGTFSGTLAAVGGSPGVSAEHLQVSLDDGQTWNAATTEDSNWSFDNTATPLQDGLHVLLARVEDMAGNVGPVTAQQVVVSTTGTLTLSLQDVLNDANALAGAGPDQQVTINSGNGLVSQVNLLTDGTDADQWQDTGTQTTINNVVYDVYHNAAQGDSTVADLLIQHGITVSIA